MALIQASAFFRNPIIKRLPTTDAEWANFLKRWEESNSAGRLGTVWSVVTPAFSGFSVNPTTLKYKVIDGQVTVWGGISGTSNATTFGFQLPEEIWPTTVTTTVCSAVDNNVQILSKAIISAAGLVTMQTSVATGTPVTWNSSGWTNSGTKGLSSTIIYHMEEL